MYIAFLTLILNLPYKFLWAYEYSSDSYELYGVYGVNLALVLDLCQVRLIQILYLFISQQWLQDNIWVETWKRG